LLLLLLGLGGEMEVENFNNSRIVEIPLLHNPSELIERSDVSYWIKLARELWRRGNGFPLSASKFLNEGSVDHVVKEGWDGVMENPNGSWEEERERLRKESRNMINRALKSEIGWDWTVECNLRGLRRQQNAFCFNPLQ
jgi:hypothetical protein